MKPPVLSKADMYRRIVAGEFGNTLPRFFSIEDWEGPGRTGMWMQYELWGVQHTTIPGFPGTRLDVARRDVRRHVREEFGGGDYCISPMAHQVGNVLWEGDVARDLDGAPGLLCCGNVNPANGSWRTHMKKPREWRGSAAVLLLRSVLDPNSYDDLMVLLDEYPGHVVELSALDAYFGTVPHRNAVVWEVRRY